jgi:hypothetical protein
MAAKGDVKAVRVTATGSVFAGRTRLRGIILSNATAGAGTITLQDETGTQFVGDCPAGDVFSFNLPEDGILFKGFMTVNAISGLTAATILLDK